MKQNYLLFSVSYQKRFKKERRTRKQIQDQLDLEIKRRTQLEDALKATGATADQIRAITGKYNKQKFFFLVLNARKTHRLIKKEN